MWDRAQNSEYSVLTPAASTYGTAYLSLADEIELMPDRLRLTLAGRGERSGLTGFTFQPTARLWWSFAKRQSVWAAWTHAVRTPSRGELAFQGDWSVVLVGAVSVVTTASGNPNLQPERSNAVDAGYRVSSSKTCPSICRHFTMRIKICGRSSWASPNCKVASLSW